MSNADCTVEYREIPGFPYYRAGSDGSIWSSNAGNNTRVSGEWRKMSLTKSKSGHLMVALRRDGRYYRLYVHRLIAMAFIGQIPSQMDVCHNDGTVDNNIPSNLRIDTRKGNLADRYIHGTMNCGTRQGHAKLNDEIIKDVFKEKAKGKSLKHIADIYGVDHSTLWSVIKRKTWRHVSIDPSLIALIQSNLGRTT